MQLLAPVLRPLAFAIVACVDFVERMLASSGSLYKVLLIPGFERLRCRVGVWRAWRSFYRTYRDVPAYRDFIDAHGGRPRIPLSGNFLPDLRSIPEMDKESYVKKYPLERRVRGGRLPVKGVMVDESSGSSGQPRGSRRHRAAHHQPDDAPELPEQRAKRRAGVHPECLCARRLGDRHECLDIAYAQLDPEIDWTECRQDHQHNEGIRPHVPLRDHGLSALSEKPGRRFPHRLVRLYGDAGYGGEGISESLRSYLLTSFRQVVGSYGASDLEVNMAIETELTIRLRRALLADAALREALIRTDYGVTPMIFQYKPLAYLLETNDKGELVVTISRPYNISPKIRYNIHDRGHVLGYGKLKEKLASAGRLDILEGPEPRVDLPILFIYGRSDMSIEYYGAKVTPDSVREILYGVKELTPILNTFRLLSHEDKDHNKRMEIAAELVKGAAPPADTAKIADCVFRRLGEMNGDFYNAMFRTATPDNMPRLTIHPFESGPFAGGQRKLKNEYVASGVTYDRLQ